MRVTWSWFHLRDDEGSYVKVGRIAGQARNDRTRRIAGQARNDGRRNDGLLSRSTRCLPGARKRAAHKPGAHTQAEQPD